MGDLLRQVHAHPNAEIVGICDEDPARMQEAIEHFELAEDRVFTDVDAGMKACEPDMVAGMNLVKQETGIEGRRVFTMDFTDWRFDEMKF